MANNIDDAIKRLRLNPNITNQNVKVRIEKKVTTLNKLKSNAHKLTDAHVGAFDKLRR